MKGFARMTKLSNIAGRADYISNPDRQESIVAASAPVDWAPYQKFEREHQKTDRRNNEGREVILALPNEWAALPRFELTRRVQTLAIAAVGKATDMQWAVHWNKARTNLHVHIVFSERQREKNPGVWDRDVYHTADGKVARRKADRARDENGKIKPPVHKKGSPKPEFTAKDPNYAKKGWLHNLKSVLKAELERFGVTIDKDGLLHEYHEGKGPLATIIRQRNQCIKATNEACEEFTRIVGGLSPEQEKNMKEKAQAAVDSGSGYVYGLKFFPDLQQLRMSRMTLDEYKKSKTPAAEQQLVDIILRENARRLEELRNQGAPATKIGATLANIVESGKIPVLHRDSATGQITAPTYTTVTKAFVKMMETSVQRPEAVKTLPGATRAEETPQSTQQTPVVQESPQTATQTQIIPEAEQDKEQVRPERIEETKKVVKSKAEWKQEIAEKKASQPQPRPPQQKKKRSSRDDR